MRAAIDCIISMLTASNPWLLCSDQLQQVVRDMERLYIEASRVLNLGSSALTAAAVPQGPSPSLLQVVEAMQDTW